ncbi:MAG: metalloregulator ArsR/SmtB family transcription factor [Acidobacteria bacterium]|nr:metalloregulator ArsR/SmtB family transcription factor [Acidobacteriota bacterium]
MPSRDIAAKELAKAFSVLSHPDRVRIIEELGSGEKDVNSLRAVLGVSHSRTSQNLAVLRTNRLVTERRDGRHVFYRLSQPELAGWILEGLRFIEGDLQASEARLSAFEEARQKWSGEPASELLVTNRD